MWRGYGTKRSSSFFAHLYNKTRHSYIYVAYSWSNGWTDWAEIFVGLNNCLTNFFIYGECRALQPVSYNVNKIAGKNRNCKCKNKTFDKET